MPETYTSPLQVPGPGPTRSPSEEGEGGGATEHLFLQVRLGSVCKSPVQGQRQETEDTLM
jgi:hypothetical protein